jgi:cephalosporin hydroxylase
MSGKLAIIPRETIRHSSGDCYVAKVSDFGRSDTDNQPGVSRLRLFEDGVELGPAHSIHVDIAGRGAGRFSHWKDELLFSSSDGSSCVENDRSYQALFEIETPTVDGLPVCSLPKGALLHIQRGIMSYQYRGIDCFKCPFDLALYQRLLWERQPRAILEFGTWRGGSALWFADVMTTYGLDCHVYSFDIAEPPLWRDPRITFRQGDVLQISELAPAAWVGRLPRPILVIDDAGHAFEMTQSVLRHFAPLLHSGEYLIIEDGVTYEMGSDFQYAGGPRRALREFLADNNDYVIDRSLCDHYGENVTWNVNGYLRRV